MKNIDDRHKQFIEERISSSGKGIVLENHSRAMEKKHGDCLISHLLN